MKNKKQMCIHGNKNTQNLTCKTKIQRNENISVLHTKPPIEIQTYYCIFYTFSFGYTFDPIGLGSSSFGVVLIYFLSLLYYYYF